MNISENHLLDLLFDLIWAEVATITTFWCYLGSGVREGAARSCNRKLMTLVVLRKELPLQVPSIYFLQRSKPFLIHCQLHFILQIYLPTQPQEKTFENHVDQTIFISYFVTHKTSYSHCTQLSPATYVTYLYNMNHVLAPLNATTSQLLSNWWLSDKVPHDECGIVPSK